MQKNINPRGTIFFKVATSIPKSFGFSLPGSPKEAAAAAAASALHKKKFLFLSLWAKTLAFGESLGNPLEEREDPERFFGFGEKSLCLKPCEGCKSEILLMGFVGRERRPLV